MMKVYIIMIKTSFINPFSEDAKEIVRKLGKLDTLNIRNDDLIDIIHNTPNQSFVGVPDTLLKLALTRFEWYLFRKTDKFEEKNYEYLFNPDIYEYDVVSFYLLCQAVAIGYGLDSHEAKQVIESENQLIAQRIDRLSQQDKQDVIREALAQLVNTDNLKWTDIKEVLEVSSLELDQLLLSNGRAIIDYDDFVIEFGGLIEGRYPQDVYYTTGGLKTKSELLNGLITIQSRKYIANVAQMVERMVEPNPLIQDLANQLKELHQEAQEVKYSGQGTINLDDTKPVKYQIEAFPPCARKCMEGIKSGGRNDAIVLFLTPFVSYARLYPGIFSLDQNMKVSDVDPSLDITHEEVLPLIYEAAQSCRPPLFKDQPQEKININSKLGFGMHDELKLDNEGETQWYTPMSCEKIKLHMPNLCHPNVDCKKIGNPLTFYNRKRKLLKRTNNGQVNNDGN